MSDELTFPYSEGDIRLKLSQLGWTTKEINNIIGRCKQQFEAHINGVRVAYRYSRAGSYSLSIIHRYLRDDICRCGGQVVYYEDTSPPGAGCSIQGRPWDLEYRMRDPQVRRAVEQSGEPMVIVCPCGTVGLHCHCVAYPLPHVHTD